MRSTSWSSSVFVSARARRCAAAGLPAAISPRQLIVELAGCDLAARAQHRLAGRLCGEFSLAFSYAFALEGAVGVEDRILLDERLRLGVGDRDLQALGLEHGQIRADQALERLPAQGRHQIGGRRRAGAAPGTPLNVMLERRSTSPRVIDRDPTVATTDDPRALGAPLFVVVFAADFVPDEALGR